MSVRYGQTMSDYLAFDALSSTVAFELATRSPLHANYKKTSGALWAKTADIGTVAHKLILEDSEDGIVLVEAADFKTKAAREARDAAYAEGKTPILAHHFDDVKRMVKAIRLALADTELADVFGKGHAEVTIDWEDNGVICKARPDYLTDEYHISLKTTAANAEPSQFARRQLASMGYDFQLAFYDRGLKANGLNVKHRILVIEQNPPHGVCVIALGADKRTIAEVFVANAIETWAKCLAEAKFPGYANGQTFVAEATAWEIAAAEERQLTAMELVS